MWTPWKKKAARTAPEQSLTGEALLLDSTRPEPQLHNDAVELADPGVSLQDRMPADVAQEVQAHLDALHALNQTACATSPAKELTAHNHPSRYFEPAQQPDSTGSADSAEQLPPPPQEVFVGVTDSPAGPHSGLISADERAESSGFGDTASDAAAATPAQTTESEVSAPAKKRTRRLAAAWSSLRDKINPSRLIERGTRPEALPIRVLMGYLPEVSARDAREYAQGIAERHFEQMGLVFFGAFEYANGYVYEVHEGGSGKAYAPEILKYFEEQGPFVTGEEHFVYVRTATRVLEVQRQRDGLAAILLPESAPLRHSEWLVATKALTPAMDRREKVLYVGGAIFASGVVALLLSGMFFRLQPFEAPTPPRPTVVTASTLPLSQWSRVQAVPDNAYVRAVRYRNGRWEAPEIQTEELSPAAMPLSPEPGMTPMPDIDPVTGLVR